ncbi:hypothetical protein WDW89_22950 [Deltaproteobacteria bacterium TL4]
MQILEKLRNRNHSNSYSSGTPIFFQIVFEQPYTYLKVVNIKGEEVSVDYRHYQNHTRTLIKRLEHLQQKSQFMIHWETASPDIDLSLHDFLIENLRHCDNVVDHELKPVNFAADTAHVQILIDIRKKHGGL